MTSGDQLQIATPEGICFSLKLAGPMVRFLAWLIDFLIVMTASIVIGLGFGVFGLLSPDVASAMGIVSLFVLQVGYGIGMEWSRQGQTIGKRAMGIRVVDAAGLRLQLHQVVMRNLLRFVDSLPLFYLVGGIAMLLNRSLQRLGDLAANTVVVRVDRVAEPDLEQLFAGKFNSLRTHPHLVARLRQKVSAEEAATALQAVVRRGELEDGPRVELFRELGEHFRTKVEFPPDTVEGIADEQYVRNVVDVLYRTTDLLGKRPAKETEPADQPPVGTTMR